MIDEKPENPPAFPVSAHEGLGTDGTKLRDYFAAAALTGLCANPNLKENVLLGKASFEIADALLKARVS